MTVDSYSVATLPDLASLSPQHRRRAYRLAARRALLSGRGLAAAGIYMLVVLGVTEFLQRVGTGSISHRVALLITIALAGGLSSTIFRRFAVRPLLPTAIRDTADGRMPETSLLAYGVVVLIILASVAYIAYEIGKFRT